MKPLLLRCVPAVRSRLPLLATSAAFLVGMLLAREVFALPKPLVITLGICFVVTIIVPGGERAGGRRVGFQIARLLGTWAILAALVLTGVHEFDRGGWIWFQITGYNGSIPEHLNGLANRAITDFVRDHPQFQIDPADPTRLVLPAGQHWFPTTVVVPRGSELVIRPGAHVELGAGASVVCYRRLTALGTSEQPITLAPRNSWLKWGVLAVIDAPAATLAHVHLAHARQATANGLDLPGGLSVINTDCDIHDCRFTSMFGKDAVYVRNARATIRHNEVTWAYKDGIDLDGSQGELVGNLLVDCDDEGIDLSDDSLVDVRQNTIRDRHGGRIAARDLDRIRVANVLEFSHRE
jgi:hypothetical protein